MVTGYYVRNLGTGVNGERRKITSVFFSPLFPRETFLLSAEKDRGKSCRERSELFIGRGEKVGGSENIPWR